MPAYRRAVSLIITKEEVKTTLFSIPSHKSLGQIGMGVDFLKICWHIVGEGTLGFYTYGRLHGFKIWPNRAETAALERFWSWAIRVFMPR